MKKMWKSMSRYQRCTAKSREKLNWKVIKSEWRMFTQNKIPQSIFLALRMRILISKTEIRNTCRLRMWLKCNTLLIWQKRWTRNSTKHIANRDISVYYIRNGVRKLAKSLLSWLTQQRRLNKVYTIWSCWKYALLWAAASSKK